MVLPGLVRRNNQVPNNLGTNYSLFVDTEANIKPKHWPTSRIANHYDSVPVLQR